MTNKIKFEPLVFFGIAFFFLLYVWSMPVFLTQDGPSHLYNSRVLLDIVTSNNSEFYYQFFEVNSKVSPNWFSSGLLSFLLYFFSPIVAEKIFISILIIAIPLAFRYAVHYINYKSIFLSSLVFVLSNSYFLIYGFYNFQWSLAFFLFFIGYYIKNRETLSIQSTFVLSFMCILIFFTHPVAFIQAAFFIGIEIIRKLVCFFKNKSPDFNEIRPRIIRLIGILIIPGFLFLLFFNNSQSSSQSIIKNNFSLDHLDKLFKLTDLITFHDVEKYVLYLFSFVVLVFFGIYCYKQKKNKRGISFSLFGLLFLNLFIYFFVSDELAGGSYLLSRTVVCFFLILLLLASIYEHSVLLKRIYLYSTLLICFSFLIIRYPYQKKIGELALSYIETTKIIKENSTVLPIGFSNKGEINSELLSQKISIFKHLGCYVGAIKQIISFNNYEANTTYFPLLWKDSINPYKHLSYNFETGLEYNPPLVDIVSFNKRENCTVDYVVLFGDPERFSDSEELNFLNHQLEKSYRIIAKSEDNLTKVYINKAVEE